jgi:DNA-binding transcriptional MerR regulator
VRISELADKVGVPVSTVRYYERIGLLPEPARTGSGYREYDNGSATQLLFVARARNLGLSCDQIVELLPIWGGSNCTSTHDEITRLIEDKKVEIGARIKELTDFVAQLDSVGTILESEVPPHACRTDLTCCIPSGAVDFVPLEGMTASLGSA